MTQAVQQSSQLLSMPPDVLTHVIAYTDRKTFDTLNCTCKTWNNEVLPSLNFTELLAGHLQFSSIPQGTITQKVYRDRTRREQNLLNGIFSLKTLLPTTKLTDRPRGLALSNGKLFYGHNENEAARIVELTNTKCLQTLKGHQGEALSLAANDSQLCVCTKETLKIWDVKTQQCTNTLQPTMGEVAAVAMAGNKLFYANADAIGIYDLTNNEHLDTLNINKICDIDNHGIMNSIAATEELLFIIPWQPASRPINIIDWRQKKRLGSFEGHTGACYIAVDDGKLFSRCLVGKSIKVWDIKTRECLLTMDGAVGIGHTLLSSDGQLFYSENDGVMCMDFNAEHSAVFNELADLFDAASDDDVAQALKRFSKMPLAARKMIYAKHYEVLKKTKPAKEEDVKWAADTFHNRNNASSTPAQKAAAIRMHTKMNT